MASELVSEQAVKAIIKDLERTNQLWEEIKMAELAGLVMTEQKRALKEAIAKNSQFVTVYGKQYNLKPPTQLPIINL